MGRAWTGFLSVIRAFSRGFRAILADVKKLPPIKAKMRGFQASATAPNLARVAVTSQEFRFMEEVSGGAGQPCVHTCFPR